MGEFPKPAPEPRVDGELGRQHFKCHRSPERLLDRLVHHSHTAPAQHPQDLEVPEPRVTAHGRRGGDGGGGGAHLIARFVQARDLHEQAAQFRG